MQKSLKEFIPNESGVVLKVCGDGAIRRRLMDMGVTPRAKITMRKSAPFGDPIEISIRGYELSLRKSEAQLIIMESGDAK